MSKQTNMALLESTHRKIKVLELDDCYPKVTLSVPVGIDLRDKLPETIALSIIAECQASLSNKTATPISGVLNKPHELIVRSA